MRFKTVSEFIHALEVERKRFVNPVDTDEYLAWSRGCICRFDNCEKLVALNYLGPVNIEYIDLTCDWQEYQAEPETEEIVLDEWLTEYEDGTFDFIWTRKGRIPKDYEHGEMLSDVIFQAKTGVTRKVKVPK